MRYRIKVAYDGTHYSGWQVQPGVVTIQQLLQGSISQLVQEETTVVGSGRTDAGVHARGQIAHFDVERRVECHRIQHALNGILPPDVRILELYPCPLDFHARFSARRKVYHYHLWLDPIMDPFLRCYRLHVHRCLDVHLLRSAARHFVGTHDFRTAANVRGPGMEPHSTVRTLFRLDVVEQEGGVRLEFEADGFLYKMVRNIMGLLLDVASGRRDLEEIDEILATRDRRQGAQAAPPQGLFLMYVGY